MGRLDTDKTKFDSLEREREGKRLQQLKLDRMRHLQEEISRMELERQEWEDPTEDDDFPKKKKLAQIEKIEPNKLTNNFEEIQRQRQQLMEQEIRLAKMQAMETELIQLQVIYFLYKVHFQGKFSRFFQDLYNIVGFQK